MTQFQKGQKPPKKGEKLAPVAVAQDAPDEVTAALHEAAALMAKAATDRANRGAILKDAEAALSKIRLIDMPDLADSPVVQAFLKAMGHEDLQVGETKNRGTLAERYRDWTLEAVNDEVKAGRMPLKRFTPNESLPLTFNGVTIQVMANEECETPECFYNIYREHMEALKQGRLHEQYLMGKSNTPPSPAYMTSESARVRAWSMQGPNGAPSGTLTTGKIIEASGEGQSG